MISDDWKRVRPASFPNVQEYKCPDGKQYAFCRSLCESVFTFNVGDEAGKRLAYLAAVAGLNYIPEAITPEMCDAFLLLRRGDRSAIVLVGEVDCFQVALRKLLGKQPKQKRTPDPVPVEEQNAVT